MNSDNLKKYLRHLLTFTCVGYIVYFLIKNHQDLKLLGNLEPVALCLLVIFSFLGQVVVAFRLRIVLHKCSDAKIAFKPWFKVFILGRFFNLIFPQFGNIYRSVRLKKDYGITYTDYISTMASFAWMDLCLNLIFALMVVGFIDMGLKIGQFHAISFLALVFFAATASPIILEFVFRKTSFKNKFINWAHQKSHEVLTATLDNLKDIKYIANIFTTAIFAFCYTIATFYFCFWLFKLDISLPALTLFYAIMRISNLVIITPGNIGLRELAYGIVGAQMGIGMTEGIVISITLRIVNNLALIALGAWLGGIRLLKERKKYKDR